MIDATPLLRGYARLRAARLARQSATAAQKRQLLRLVRRAAGTRFGTRHDFAGIRTVADFQARVPLRRYEDFWAEYWRDAFPRLTDVTWPGTVRYFALTSGTTSGPSKYIPVTRAMNRSNRRAALDLVTHHLRNRPDSRLLEGRTLLLGGSTALVEEAPGIYSGDLSGIAARDVPFWARRHIYPPAELALIDDWEEKIDRLARGSLEADIRAISGTPSWLLRFFERLAELRPDARGLAGWYPDLELLVHGGVAFQPYRRQFEQLLEGSHAELREVYPASEGFVAVADRGPGEGMRAIVDNGLFYEFVPVDELDAATPTRHWAATAELGVNYALVLSSCAGLWAYVLGDTVRLVDRDPLRLLVTGRTSYMLSAFGEHLIGEEIEAAVAAAADAIGRAVADFAVGAIFPVGPLGRGGHLYIVEFAGGVPDAAERDAFARAVDDWLAAANPDYRSHRRNDVQMKRPEILAVAPGSFDAWMKSRGRLGGQNKVPRVVTDPELFESLRRFMTAR